MNSNASNARQFSPRKRGFTNKPRSSNSSNNSNRQGGGNRSYNKSSNSNSSSNSHGGGNRSYNKLDNSNSRDGESKTYNKYGIAKTSSNSPGGNRRYSSNGNSNKSSSQGNRGGFRGASNNRNSSFRGRSKFSNNKNRRNAQHIDRSKYINDLQSEVAEDKANYDGKKYSDFKLQLELAENLKIKGYETTTEIQEKCIPLIMNGDNILGISPTGSGKTGAFLIPMIEKMLTDKSQKLLVVAPTRELAMQIAKEAITLIRNTFIQQATIIGGASMSKQISQLRKGGHIVVSTPGRLNDLVERGNIKLDQYNNIVVDEVDRMLDMGFISDIKFIFSKLAEKKQGLFFSATHNKSVEKIVDSLIDSFVMVRLASNAPSKSVVQSVIDFSHREEKIELLQEILKKDEVEKAIIFVDTKRFADKVGNILFKGKFKVGVIHGDKRQNVRRRVIDMFKHSKIDFLVATNVAARGIDIDDITHVINLDEPQTYDEYIHRIGRTGRNGSLGTAYTFVRRGN